MKILFDLQHPAHLHFFRNVIDRLKEEGHTIKVTGRDKDILVELADKYRVDVEFFGTAHKGVLNLSYELLYRQRRLYGIIREFKPDLMMAIAGTFIAPLGWLLRIPVDVFYDTESATISNLIAYPFATCVYVPRCYRKRLRVRHVRYDGYHELAYLHPDYFRPDPAVLVEAGLTKDDIFTIVRFVSWGAAHDIGKKGFTDENKIKAVGELARLGSVFISSEGDLPGELEAHRTPVGVERIHDLMAYASLVFGESATMASEAAVMGVPSVYLDPVGRGYTDEQEKKYGIVFNYKPDEQIEAIDKGVELLKTADRAGWKEIGKRIIRENQDVTTIIYNVAHRTPSTKDDRSKETNRNEKARAGSPVITPARLQQRCHDTLLRVAAHFRLPSVLHQDIPPGCNGPHKDCVNNLRVISHLTILSYYLYRTTGQKGYLDWARASIPYIERFKDPQTGVYLNRNQPGKDPNNGLIGQVWVIQALLFVLDILTADEIERLILTVIESHGFDDRNNLYTFPVKNGRRTVFLPQFTLNQQIWFSSIIGAFQKTGNTEVFQAEQGRFLNGLRAKVRIKEERINHVITREVPPALKARWVANNPRTVSTYLRRRLTGDYRSLEMGYVSFLLMGIYGNDELYNAFGDRKALLDNVLKRYTYDISLLRDDNPFARGYNMSGIELAISYLGRYGRLDDAVINTLLKQIDPPYDYTIADFTTYMARHYELIYLIEALRDL